MGGELRNKQNKLPDNKKKVVAEKVIKWPSWDVQGSPKRLENRD